MEVTDAALRPGRPTPKEAALFLNVNSRRGREFARQTSSALERHGILAHETHRLSRIGSMPELIHRSLERGITCIIVGGGDGTIRLAASSLIDTSATLGVLPFGTVNDFARNLEIPLDIDGACRVIAAGHSARIDVGMANDDCFLITASVGFAAQIQKYLSSPLKRVFGPLGYLVAALLALSRMRPLRIAVQSGETRELLRAMQTGVINGHYWMGGHAEIPGVDLRSGCLAFYAVPPQRGLAYLRVACDVMRGQFFRSPGLYTFTASEIYLETSRPRRMVLDGDTLGRTPVRLRIMADALRVFVPESFQKQISCSDGSELPGVCDPVKE